MSEAKHTPLPWSWRLTATSEDMGDHATVIRLGGGEDGNIRVGALDIATKDDADLIVRAVNSHAELLAACELAAEHLEGSEFDCDLRARETILAAVRKAKGETT